MGSVGLAGRIDLTLVGQAPESIGREVDLVALGSCQTSVRPRGATATALNAAGSVRNANAPPLAGTLH
jgi:hypothetical protein